MSDSMLDYASIQGVDEVVASAGQKVQALISSASEVASARSYQRAERAREAAARSEAEHRQLQKQQDALYEADRLVWRRVWSEDFWDKATPERIARAWEAAAAWASDEFPAARATIEHMRGEIADRYGITVDPVQARGADLAALLGSPPGTPDTPTPDAAAQARLDRLDTITYRLHGPGGHTQIGVVHLAAEDSSDVARHIAAERLADYQREHDGRCGIEVFAGDRVDWDRQLFTLDGDSAQQLRDRYSRIVAQPREADARAAQTAEQGMEVAAVLRTERHRLRKRLTELSNGEEAAFAAAPADPGERRTWAREQAEDIRARLGSLTTRLQAVEADLRGENGDVVMRWAALRYELDERWWQNATGQEVSGVWERVAGWPAGRARDQALEHLRTAIHREYDVELPRDASVEHVRQALAASSSREAPPGTGAREAGIAEELRGRARDEDAEHRRAHEASDRLRRDDPEAVEAEAEHEWAEAQWRAAEQDRDAAVSYERLAEQGHKEAAEAARTIVPAYPAAPVARLKRAAAPSKRRQSPGRAPVRSLVPRGHEIER